MKLEGLAAISATATPQRVYPPCPSIPHTLRNASASTVYYRYDPADGDASGLAGASQIVMRAAGGSALPAGVAVIIPPDTLWLDIACITGETATVYLDGGEQLQLAPA